jgi:predicted nucleic acid binding AN1-type Zn finger protein
MPATCQLGTFLKRCHATAIGSCQYCGRTFCSKHGQHLEENQEVCARRLCQAKVADLRDHVIYRDQARVRSARGLCGAPDCSGPRTGQCSKCGALYCERHLHNRDEVVHRGLMSFSRPASFCDHCLARRKLWSRV